MSLVLNNFIKIYLLRNQVSIDLFYTNCDESTGRIELVFGMAGLLRPIPCCVIRKFVYLRKLGYFPLGLLSQTPDLENFATASQSRCQQNSSSSSSKVEFVDDTYTTVDESWLFTTSRPTVTSNSIIAICCGFVVQLVSLVDKILTNIVRRAVLLR